MSDPTRTVWHERLERLCLFGLQRLDDRGWRLELAGYLEDLQHLSSKFAQLKVENLTRRMPIESSPTIC